MHTKNQLLFNTSCYLEHSVITLKLREEYLNTVTRNTPVLLWIKAEQFGVYNAILCQHNSYKLSKNTPVLAHPVLVILKIKKTFKIFLKR